MSHVGQPATLPIRVFDPHRPPDVPQGHVVGSAPQDVDGLSGPPGLGHLGPPHAGIDHPGEGPSDQGLLRYQGTFRCCPGAGDGRAIGTGLSLVPSGS